MVFGAGVTALFHFKRKISNEKIPVDYFNEQTKLIYFFLYFIFYETFSI
jgi:hypothetical protein